MTDRLLSLKIIELPDIAQALARRVADLRTCRVFAMGDCRIIVTHEPHGWHMSISTPFRDPTWAEIATARYRLLGNVPHMVMDLPPLAEYVNLHPYTFHLFEAQS